MRMLVTGGGGFLGAALVAQMASAGHRVRVLDDYSRGHPARLKALGGGIELIRGDVCNARTVQDACEGCEMVWHLAYISGTRFLDEAPDRVLEVAIKGVINTIEAALAQGVRRYVLASSGEVYHTPTHLPTTEVERLVIPDVTNSRFSYGGGKIASELLTLHFGGRRGLETVIFRPHNIYGPDMGFDCVIPRLVEKMIRLSNSLRQSRIDLPIEGDGSESRTFCYVSDAARGAYLAGMRGEPGGLYHLGAERETSILELVKRIAGVLGLEVSVVAGKSIIGRVPRRLPAIAKLRKLGYDPMVSLEEGLERTVVWYRDFFLQASPSPPLELAAAHEPQFAKR